MNLSSEPNKRLVLKAHCDGHQIANHTYSHPSLVGLDKTKITTELLDTKNAILAIIGNDKQRKKTASIVRPPYGDINPIVQEVIDDLGFTSLRWNSDRYDWQLSPNEGKTIKQRVKQHLDFIANKSADNFFNQSIIDVNHDKSVATLSALDQIIPIIKEAGYRFVSMSKCLGLD